MTGRWPANVILSPSMAEALDGQSGFSKSEPIGSVAHIKARTGQVAKGDERARESPKGYGDEGGASRFFLNAGYEPWELEWILANGLRPCE